MAVLDLQAGRTEDATAHLHEQLQIAMQTGLRLDLLVGLDGCGYLCASTQRPAEAVTVWAAMSALAGPGHCRTGPGVRAAGTISCTRPGRLLGPDRTQAAEERGAAMSPATAAEYALMLATAEPQPPAADAAAAHRTAADGAAGRDARPGQAQPQRTRTRHPGRAGVHRRADRGPAVHQRAHGQLAPRPDPGQDRMPPPHRPDPPRARRRPGLTLPGSPSPAWSNPAGSPSPACRARLGRSAVWVIPPRARPDWVIPPQRWPRGKWGRPTPAAGPGRRASLGPRAGKPASSG